jgi:ketosteroid isomerase-like protein
MTFLRKEGEIAMSAQEDVRTLAEGFADAFNKKDIKTALGMLSDDLEVFDHVPYRFDNKAQFADFLTGAVEGVSSMSFGFRQPSCRVFNDNTGVFNAYDTFTGVTKDGKLQTIHGRTTLVFVKQIGQWKIVSAHFSPLPHA